MNNDLDNVHRSVRRWVALLLPSPPWTLRLEDAMEARPDDDRPYGIVQPVTNVDTVFARATIPQGDVRRQTTMSITLYPGLTAVDSGDVLSRREARLQATQLAQLLLDGLEVGVLDASVTPNRQYGGPLKLPLWEYAGIPVTGAGRAGPVLPYGSVDVENPTARPIPDDDEGRRWTVQVSFRAQWWAAGRARVAMPAEPIIRTVPGSFKP